jgi:hypothetical protein
MDQQTLLLNISAGIGEEQPITTISGRTFSAIQQLALEIVGKAASDITNQTSIPVGTRQLRHKGALTGDTLNQALILRVLQRLPNGAPANA